MGWLCLSITSLGHSSRHHGTTFSMYQRRYAELSSRTFRAHRKGGQNNSIKRVIIDSVGWFGCITTDHIRTTGAMSTPNRKKIKEIFPRTHHDQHTTAPAKRNPGESVSFTKHFPTERAFRREIERVMWGSPDQLATELLRVILIGLDVQD